nr:MULTISPECIES: AAA family ATPase [unclassified Ruegeria]
MTDQYRRGLDVELSGTGLASAGDPELRTLSNIAWAIRRSLPWIMVMGFVGAVIAYIFTYTSDTRYTSSAKVMMETRVQTETQFTPYVSGLPLSLTSLESELELLRSTDLIEGVVDRMQLYLDPEFSGEDTSINLSPIALARSLKNSLVDALSGDNDEVVGSDSSAEELARETTIENLLKSTRIEQIGDISAVYQIRVTAKSPQKAADIANSLASEYLSNLTTMKRNDLVQSQSWLTTRIGHLRDDLNKLSSDLETHSIEIPYSPDEYATIKAQRIKAERRAQLVENELARIKEQTSAIHTLRAQGKSQEAIDFAKKIGLLPPDLGQDANTEEALKRISAAQDIAEKRVEQLDDQLNDLNRSIEVFRAQQAEQVQHDSVTKRIENEILVTEAIYRDFVSQLGRRAEQGDYLDAGAHLIERARVSVDPSEPKRSQTSIGVMFMIIFAGLGWTVMREIFQKRLRTTYEFESATGVKLSAILPEIKNAPQFEAFFTNDGKLDPEFVRYGKKLLASSDVGLRSLRQQGEPSFSQAVEFFSKSLDGKPNQSFSNNGCVIFSGASALPDEGKTSSLLLIGSVCAKTKFRTLIIDCDTVASAYRDLSKLSVDELKYCTANPSSFQEHIVATPQDGLDILPLAGNLDSETKVSLVEEFLRSPAFINLLITLSDMYEVILLDTPPLLAAVESAYLSQISQRVILFTRWNDTHRNSVFQAIRELENADVRPAALVATRVDLKRAKKYGDPNLG